MAASRYYNLEDDDHVEFTVEYRASALLQASVTRYASGDPK